MDLLQAITSITGPIRSTRPVGGGCIHHGQRIDAEHGTFFLKSNHRGESANFAAEAQGLQLLREHSPLRIPRVYQQYTTASETGLLLEWIEPGRKDAGFWEKLGEGLARQHRETSAYFGLDHDNFIGRLPQSNTQHASWAVFFREERLLPQLAMPQAAALIDRKTRQAFDQLFTRLTEIFPQEPPALLHGDLWGGNLLCNSQSEPVLIDPAVYYGHREMEIAFMQLFDSQPASFWDVYQANYPLAPGWESRIDICNLYPLLVHLNLFGASYLGQIRRIIKRFG